tara:strand:+ start:4234 stop:9033 length:4800 start_codon:yes stop_codon:yes gene_type:complete
MAIVTTNFILGRMNKSIDERLLPPGEYIDAMNVRLGSTETTEVGAVENTKGNSQLTTLGYDNTAFSPNSRCIGAYEDGANETVYWFVHDPSNTKFGKLDTIVSFNTNTNSLRYHVITIDTLNFDPKFLITAVEKIEDLLFFSDGLNPPRKINVIQNYPFPNGNVDSTIDLDLNVIQQIPGFEAAQTGYIPLSSPTFELLTLPGSQNYIEERFLSFAYRYRYKNNEYSATSLFSNPAFKPGQFKFSVKNYDNEGMKNRFNAVNVSFGTGDKRVIEVDLLFKDSSTNSIYVIERFNKLDSGWADNTTKTFLFTNAKIYSVLGADELLRLYDNVPKKAQALTIMGNRLIYGNYTDGYNITNSSGQSIPMDYSTELLTKPILQQDMTPPVLVNGAAYTIDPNTTVTATNGRINFDLTEVSDKLKQNAVIGFSLDFEHSSLSGTTTTDCYEANELFVQPNLDLSFNVILQQDYTSVFSLSQSSEFANAIGTVLNSNFNPIATASEGVSLTDRFNVIIVAPAITCAFTKTLSGIDDQLVQQPFRIIATAGSNTIGLQIPAMKFKSVGDPTAVPPVPDTDIYEYYRFIGGSSFFSSDDDLGSLHSNRDFATGIVYMDDYGRASTVLTADFNTISVPSANSTSVNRIKVVLNNYAPSWASKYKFVVKPSKANYETIFSNFQYTNTTNQVTYFKLEGDNQNKVKTGDTLIVKTDTSGPLTTLVKTKVLEVEAEGSNFLAQDTVGLGETSEQLAGLYMQIKASNFSVVIPNDSIVEYGQVSTARKSSSTCKARINYPFFTTDSDTGVTNNYTIPAGSTIIVNIRVSRADRSSSCEGFDWQWDQEFQSQDEYPDARRWWQGDNISPALAVPGAVSASGDGSIEAIYNSTLFNYNADIPCTQTDGTPTGDNAVFFAWGQDVSGDATSPLGLIVKTKKPGCSGGWPFRRSREIKIRADITVIRATTLLTFETEPVDASADVFFDASEAYNISLDVPSGNYLHEAPGGGGNQSQSSTQPLVVSLPFIDCYTFGNGVESFKIKDDLAGRALKMGQRFLAVSNQDFKEADRFADLTYSGIFSSNAGINNLNEFNLGLVNFKELETSFGPIQKLHARETDILTLQEDKISYVLASKNLISDSVGGGAIVSSPTILGTQMARIEEYGISFNPESFAAHGDSFYFTDTKRVSVIKLTGGRAGESLEVISDAGMRSWFRDEFQLALETQKLGGFDPFMDEFVLSTNDIKVPVPPVIYECGIEFQGRQSAEVATYTVDLTSVIGNAPIAYNVSSGSVTITAVWNGVTFTTGQVSGTGNLTIAKTATSPTTAVITVTPNGAATYTIIPKCVQTTSITVVKCVISSNFDGGNNTHVEYKWDDGVTISPVDSDGVELGSNSQIFSFFDSQTGNRSQGVYPYDGADLTMRINKLATDNYNWEYPQDNFRYLSSTTLYTNTPSSVAALLAASTTIPNSLVVNPTGTTINQATVGPATTPAFTLPIGNPYLYLIYDLRFTSAQDICFSDVSASDACCLCNVPCDSFLGSNRTNIAFVCSQPLSQTYYFTGDGVEPAIGDLTYSNQQCAGNTPGVNINNLQAGYYKISGSQYIQVNNFGIIIEKTNC